MKWLREEPDNLAWLEESNNDWGIVANVTMRCCGTDCIIETYVRVNNCPMCGRELGVDV